MFSAGNAREEGHDVNLFDLANSRYTIAVAAIDSTGHYSYYSSPGAALLISGYTDNIVTTDRTGEAGYNSAGTFDGDPLPDINYTSTFNGTSSSAPLVSGVIALILEANPTLTYRDVQYILVNSAELNDPSDSDWTVNAAGYHVNHNYGFGAIDADAAVQLAFGWENVSEEVTTGSGQIQVNQVIPDGNPTGLTVSVALDDTVTDIEWVEVTIDTTHSSPADLEVILTSPDGTQSRLANATDQTYYFNTTGYSNWTFTTSRDWGESSEGTWTLSVRDRFGGVVGSFNSWELNVFGQHLEDVPEPPDPTVEGIGPELVAVVPNAGSTIQNGAVLHISPRELMFQFNEEQEIDPDTLGAIQIVRAGGDGILGNANDQVVEFGWIGIGDRPNEVIVRFAGTLPDDLYEITIVGSGDAPLTNIDGDLFHQGEDVTMRVTLDLGAQVIAVVPQPTYRDAAGKLQQSRNTIEVYFNDDDLDRTTAENPLFYRLSVTFETATPDDNVAVNPTAVVYDPVHNKATLTFADDLATIGIGAFRLRIGNEYHAIATSTMGAVMVGDTFDSAEIVGQLGGAIEGQSVIITSTIEPQPYDLAWPGSEDEPGHRDLPDPREFRVALSRQRGDQLRRRRRVRRGDDLLQLQGPLRLQPERRSAVQPDHRDAETADAGDLRALRHVPGRAVRRGHSRHSAGVHHRRPATCARLTRTFPPAPAARRALPAAASPSWTTARPGATASSAASGSARRCTKSATCSAWATPTTCRPGPSWDRARTARTP